MDYLDRLSTLTKLSNSLSNKYTPSKPKKNNFQGTKQNEKTNLQYFEQQGIDVRRFEKSLKNLNELSKSTYEVEEQLSLEDRILEKYKEVTSLTIRRQTQKAAHTWSRRSVHSMIDDWQNIRENILNTKMGYVNLNSSLKD
ncbi:hypothetical protein M0813_22809 [Anaeramoeba flamelloides]|uniref:Uncharacterized protein n=1 Tax=Anaeramoeba flamelloides TaxID=1746091 RepID=A0AAV7YS02_9EUKA|nr:hypothetical protein M0812_21498 [Anaeramoeba flamelloides]KAJ6242037.1 hypothetical protein M0813_22809 [Anaeramoeba flamelloides]